MYGPRPSYVILSVHMYDIVDLTSWSLYRLSSDAYHPLPTCNAIYTNGVVHDNPPQVGKLSMVIITVIRGAHDSTYKYMTEGTMTNPPQPVAHR